MRRPPDFRNTQGPVPTLDHADRNLVGGWVRMRGAGGASRQLQIIVQRLTYQPLMHAGLLAIHELRKSLCGRRIGRQIRYLPTTDSTNDEVWRLLDDQSASVDQDGCVVFAEHQTAGRGRLGRSWHAPRGASLLMSIGLLDDSLGSGPELGLIAAVCIWEALTEMTDLRPLIKWPNDILVGDRKLAGVLVESRLLRDGRQGHVIGLGVNCLQHSGHFPAELMGQATSIELESSRPVDRTGLAVALLAHLDRWLARPRTWHEGELRAAWLARANAPGCHVVLTSRGRSYSGTIIDVDPVAALIVRLDNGDVCCFNAADTSLQGPWARTAICA